MDWMILNFSEIGCEYTWRSNEFRIALAGEALRAFRRAGWERAIRMHEKMLRDFHDESLQDRMEADWLA